MPVKILKPTTNARRQMTHLINDTLTTKKPTSKKLLKSLKKNGGRNNRGLITCRHRGGGSRRQYRLIDFRGDKIDITATVKTIEYDPNRSANIALICYQDGEKRYILAPQDLKVGDKIINTPKGELKIGNRLQIKNIPTGFFVHNIELNAGRGGQIVRSAGSSAQIIGNENDKIQIKLPSGAIIVVNGLCMASIGIVSNPDYSNVSIGKAGRTRWLGRRPKVRGKAMNPVDHPHGGGEGRNSIGLKYAKTPWGAHALGVKTRKIRKYSNASIVKGRKKR